MKTDFKSSDVLNRRQSERPLRLGIHDISCARYFTVGEQSFRYSIKSQQFSSDYVVYSEDDNVRKCIGYAKPDRNKIIIQVRNNGLDWSTKIPFSSIHIYGNKLPNE